MPRLCRWLSFLVMYTLAFPPRVLLAATPESLTLTPSSGVTTFTSSLIGGVANDGTLCTEDVSCDTVGIVVSAGDYTGHNLRVAIDWLVPANDFDLYAFRDGLGGPAVGASHGPAPGTHEEFMRIVAAGQTKNTDAR